MEKMVLWKAIYIGIKDFITENWSLVLICFMYGIFSITLDRYKTREIRKLKNSLDEDYPNRWGERL